MVISSDPVLMYLKVHSAPVLENHHFRHAITKIQRRAFNLNKTKKTAGLLRLFLFSRA